MKRTYYLFYVALILSIYLDISIENYDIAILLPLITKKINLTKSIEKHRIIKRNMMTGGTILSPLQKQLAVGVVMSHINLLRKKDITTDDFLNNVVEGVATYGKVYQHMMVVLYPNLNFKTETIQAKFPNIGIVDNGSGIVDMNFVVAAAGGSKIIKKLPFSKNGNLRILDTTPVEKVDEQSPAYLDTKQKNPDYFFSTKNWQRYYDYKSGQIKIDKGNIQIISSEEDFIEKSNKLFVEQYGLYKRIYPDSDLVIYMKKLLESKDKSWSDKYELYKNYLADNLQNYSGINPSFYIFEKLSYKMSCLDISKNVDGNITTYTFSSAEATLVAFRKIVSDNTETLQQNYNKLNPLGLGEKKLFTKFVTLIENVLS